MKKFSELRNLEKELASIESQLFQNSSFSKAYRFIEELTAQKLKFEGAERLIPDIRKEIDELTHKIEDEQTRIIHNLN